jgi:hypothetical protein
VKPHITANERIAKWEADLARVEAEILRNRRWGEARRFTARANWNRHARRNWLIDRIADAKALESRREAALYERNTGS